MRACAADEVNAWLVDSCGQVRQTFSFGDGIKGVFCTDDYVVVTYFDEGIFGGMPIPAEGLAVFDRSGEFLWGWNGTLTGRGRAPLIDDCYAVLHLSGNRVAFCAYTEFALIILDLHNRKVVVRYTTPDALHGTVAISVRDGLWYFLAPWGVRNSILSWRPGRDDTPTVAAQVLAGSRRGLAGGRFLHVSPAGAGISTMPR